MKRLGIVLSLVFCLNAFSAFDFVSGTYVLDPVHTRVSFLVNHFAVSEVEGRFNDAAGEFTLTQPFTSSKMSATVQAKSIDTNVRKRDDNLRSKDFLDVEKYPTIKMVSKLITGAPGAFTVVMTLTIKDVTKDVPFEGKYTGTILDGKGGARAAIQLTGIIDRRDFHIDYTDPGDVTQSVGEDIRIHVWTEGVKTTDASKPPVTK